MLLGTLGLGVDPCSTAPSCGACEQCSNGGTSFCRSTCGNGAGKISVSDSCLSRYTCTGPLATRVSYMQAPM
eukprot:6176755-Amphidinium_carterae.1